MKDNAILRFRRLLLDWYRSHHRPLPWRSTRNPYSIWVSEVMAQQTQIKTVIPYYLAFMKRFPDVKRLAGADLQAVLKAWEGLGYYARARNLHRAAGRVMEIHKGKIPGDWKRFQDLPGVGDYIASAVLSIAFGHPHAVVDGNVKRVLSRVMKIDVPVNGPGGHKTFKAGAQALLDPEHPGNCNQAVMELGALVCTPRSPDCPACPVRDLCRAHGHGVVEEYPKRIERRPVPEHRIALGVVRKNGRVLITQRPAEGLLGGLWVFPGGRIEPGETARAACSRTIGHKVNLDIRVGKKITRVRHAYSHFKIVADIFWCDYLSGRVRRKGPVAHRWIRISEIDRYPFPGANHKFIPFLK
jgi:A/G-specific adenine glycosylase